MSSIRILVAEDNEDHLFFIERALQQLDGDRFAVETVRNGVDALDFLRRRGRYEHRERPHLILLDLRMPRVDGLEVLEAIKGDPGLRSIPVCVLTSSARQEDIDASYSRGTNTYVVKDPSFSGIRDGLRAVTDFWTDTARLPSPPL